MSLGYPSDQRSSSWTLVVVFVLGILIGSSLTYAAFDLLGVNFGPPPEPVLSQTTTEQPGAPDDADTPPTDPGDAVEPPEESAAPIAPASADLEGIWPARYLILGVGVPEADPELISVLADYRPGGALLNDDALGEVRPTRFLVRALRAATGSTGPGSIPLIHASLTEDDGAYRIPAPDAPAIANLADIETDVEAIRAAGASVGAALRARGVDLVLGPTLDAFTGDETLSNPARHFGTQTEPASRRALMFAEGLRERGVLPIGRLYPGGGSAIRGETGLKIDVPDLTELASRVFAPFAAAARVGTPGILVGPIAVPVLDGANPDLPAVFSPKLVELAFRTQWSYEGLLLADDLSSAARGDRSMGAAVVAALAAGNDAVILNRWTRTDIEDVCATILAALESGALNEEDLLIKRSRLERAGRILAQSPLPPLPPAEQATPRPAAPEGAAPAEPSPPEGEPEEGETRAAMEGEPSIAAPETQPAPEPEAAAENNIPENTREIVYTIERGDTLTGLAQEYGVTQQQIRDWNDLEDNNIKWGLELTLYVPISEGEPGEGEVQKPIDSMPAKSEAVSDIAEPTEGESSEPAPTATEEEPEVTAPAEGEAPLPAPEDDEPTSEGESPAVEEPPAPTVEDVPLEAPADSDSDVTSEADILIEYVVPEDASIFDIALDFGVTVTEIRKWNNLDSIEVTPGSTLTLYVSPDNVPEDNAQSDLEAAAPPETTEVSPPAAQAPESDAETINHTVGRGDTLRRIASQYGTTPAQIIELNDIRDPNLVMLGTRLKVPAPQTSNAESDAESSEGEAG